MQILILFVEKRFVINKFLYVKKCIEMQIQEKNV